MIEELFADVAQRGRVAAFSVAIALCVPSALALAHGTPPPESIAADQTSSQEVVVVPPPPRGFDPASASDTELQQNGFPPRPDPQSEPDAYAHWKKLVSVPRVANPKLQLTTITNNPAQRLRIGGTLQNGTTKGYFYNWSGAALAANKHTFTKNMSAIYGEWVVPVAQQAFGVCNGFWDYSSQWVGFDGLNNSDVLQAGTEVDAYCSAGTTSTFYSAWYEWYPYDETRVSLPDVEPGDYMGVEVWYTTESPNGNAYIANFTLDSAESYAFTIPPSTTYYGDSAEWIEERPEVGGVYADLTNYVADGFTYSFAQVGKSYYYPTKGGTKDYALTMVCDSSYWSPGSSCSEETAISIPYLFGLDTFWVYDAGPAYGSGLSGPAER